MEKKKEKKKLILIIILFIILIGAGVLSYFLYFKDNVFNKNETQDNIKKEKEEWDTRVYPLTLLFFERDGWCFKAENDKCMYVRDDTHYDYGKIGNKKILAEYKCKSDECALKDYNWNKNTAIILDNSLYVFEVKNKNKYLIKLSDFYFDCKVELLDINGKDDYDLYVNTGSISGNVYNTKKEDFIYEKSSFSSIKKIDGNYYGKVDAEDSSEIHIFDKDGKLLNKISIDKGAYSYNIYELEDFMVVSSSGKYNVMKKSDFTKVYEFEGDKLRLLDKFLIVTSKDRKSITIYDSDSLNLIKKIDNADSIGKFEVNNKTFYVTYIGYENYSATAVLDKDLNPIISSNSLPAICASYVGGKHVENTGCKFLPNFNTLNNTISLWLDKIYVYDLNGNLVRTIEHNGIVGLTKNYFVLQEGNDIEIYDYDDKFVKKIVTLSDGENINNKNPYGEFFPHMGTLGNKFQIYISDSKGDCTKYIYNPEDGVVSNNSEACSNY